MAESDHPSPLEMLGMAIPADAPPVVQAVFSCCRDGETAGTVGLYGPDGHDWLLICASFLCRHQLRLTGGSVETLKDALARADAEQLFGLDLEFAPFFCPKCRAVYCGKCWDRFEVMADDFPGFLEEVRGRCPNGHERMLAD